MGGHIDNPDKKAYDIENRAEKGLPQRGGT
jgi:hypothetical protein